MGNGTDLIKIIISVKSLFYRIKVILELKKVNLFKDDVRRVSTLECLRLKDLR